TIRSFGYLIFRITQEIRREVCVVPILWWSQEREIPVVVSIINLVVQLPSTNKKASGVFEFRRICQKIIVVVIGMVGHPHRTDLHCIIPSEVVLKQGLVVLPEIIIVKCPEKSGIYQASSPIHAPVNHRLVPIV